MSPTPRRIALAITELETGGAERAFVQLALGLAERGDEVRVWSLGPRPASPRDELLQRLEDARIPVEFLGLASGWSAPWALWRLSGDFKKFRPRVVQSFLYHANVVVPLAAGLAGVPVVCTGVRVADPRTGRHRMERWTARWVDRIVCVSDSVAEFCRTTARLPTEKIASIPNGVDFRRFADAMPVDLTTIGMAPGRRALISVGRLHEQKGLDWLMPKMPMVFARCPDVDWILVGDGPRRSTLESMARQLGVAERVRFVGWRADVAGLMKSAAALALPSRWEGMPNVVLEGMAAGLPIVATRVEGVEQALGAGAGSQTVEAGDLAGFARRLIEVLDFVHAKEELGKANQIRCEREFSLPAVVERYSNLYGQ